MYKDNNNCRVILQVKNQQAGFLFTGCLIKAASMCHSSRPMASPMQGKVVKLSFLSNDISYSCI